MADFDPYHKWLGIPPKDQPPHHYRLLSIDLFESDLDVIEVAANKQMAFLQTCATGPRWALSQRLLNEVAVARLCLLNVKTKDDYDAKLRTQLAAANRQPASPPNLNEFAVSSAQPSGEVPPFNNDDEEPIEIHDLIRNVTTTKTFYSNFTFSFASVWAVSVLLACGVAVLLVRFSQSDEASTPDDPEKPNSAVSQDKQKGAQKSKNVTRSPEQITNSIGMKLTLIPAGEFLMGTSEQSTIRFSDEIPQHLVKITKPFYLGTYEVTQREYAALFSGLNPSTVRNDALPVTNVDWGDALSFCRKLSEKEQRAYRLPTEAEWEYACWAGTNDWLQQNKLSDFSWHFGNANQYPHPVGTRQPNPFGLYDMFGNVAEWCHDWYGYDYYAVSGPLNPSGPLGGSSRSIRGGDWDTSIDKCRRAYRGAQSESVRNGRTGFRVVLETGSHRESALTTGQTKVVSSSSSDSNKESTGGSIRTESKTKATEAARPPVRYEAEKSRIGGTPVINFDPNASGRSKVGRIDSPDSFVEFSVQAASAGKHRVAVRYSNATFKNPTATHRVAVNGQSVGVIYYPTTGNWWSAFSTAAINVDLQMGTNTIRFSKGDHFAELDYVDLSPSPRNLTRDDIVGVWRHRPGTATPGDMALLASGKINDANGKSTWSFQGTTLILRWPNSKAPGGEWIDTVVVSVDGKTYEGANQQGFGVRGEKLRP